LSEHFFAKEWPQLELDGLASLETDGTDRILPVWHHVTRADVAKFSPILADRVAANSSRGLVKVVEQIQRAVGRVPAVTPASAPMKRAARRAAANRHLALRGIEGTEGEQMFGVNGDTALLATRPCDGGPRPPIVVLSLVPVGVDEELDPSTLLNWGIADRWPAFHPMSGADRRPRGDGLIIKRAGLERETIKRYTYIAADGYVEWGRALGECYENEFIFLRLGPLLWAVSHLYGFLDEFRAAFGLSGDYDLVVSSARTRGTVLADLGEGWREPWSRDFDYHRPQCDEPFVQFRRPLPVPLTEVSRFALLFELDRYLNLSWGENNARGHDSPRSTTSPDPVLSTRFRGDDPWQRDI
jgi:hypothetical protein